MAAILGVESGTITLSGGGTTIVTEGSCTIEMEEIVYTPMVASGADEAGWQIAVPGGGKKVTGSVSGPLDDGASVEGPIAATLSTFTVNVGSGSLSGSCLVTNWTVDKSSEGLVTYSCDFTSSGEVTYA